METRQPIKEDTSKRKEMAKDFGAAPDPYISYDSDAFRIFSEEETETAESEWETESDDTEDENKVEIPISPLLLMTLIMRFR